MGPCHDSKKLGARISFLEFRALQLGQVPHLFYSSERFKTWAHPVRALSQPNADVRTGSDESDPRDTGSPLSERE